MTRFLYCITSFYFLLLLSSCVSQTSEPWIIDTQEAWQEATYEMQNLRIQDGQLHLEGVTR